MFLKKLRHHGFGRVKKKKLSGNGFLPFSA